VSTSEASSSTMRILRFDGRRRALDGDPVRGLKAPELVFGDPEMAAGRLERREVPLADPPLHGGDGHLTGRRDLTGRQEPHTGPNTHRRSMVRRITRVAPCH
jgi:hypothetical protein